MPSLKDRLREKGVNVVEFETMRTDDHQIFQETAGPRHSGAARTLDLMKTWVLGSPKQLQKMIAQGYLRGKFPIFEASAARKKEVVELVKESRVLTDLQLTFPADDAAKKPFVVATLTPRVQRDFFVRGGLPLPEFPPESGIPKDSVDDDLKDGAAESKIEGADVDKSQGSHNIASPSRKRERPVEDPRAVVAEAQQSLATPDASDDAVVRALRALKECNMDRDTLVESKIGKTINGFREHKNPQIELLAKRLFVDWKNVYRSG
eukprot:GEMP01042450.1.p1 GENE.GEMP01042450.1~~GEMP01042450.1.p1  ORF type:complete len:264 (+),score=87.83 GEMP01042450.1:89-880(+)